MKTPMNALMKILLLLSALSCLTACGTLSTASVVDTRARTAHVSESVKRACAEPVQIPAGIARAEEWRLWGRDRQALVDCAALNAAKGEAISALEGQGAR